MKLLVICKSFAPSSGVAAKRITNFVRCLSAFGHDITVICSGITKVKHSPETMQGLEHVKIHQYEKENMPRGNNGITSPKQVTNRRALPSWLRIAIHVPYDPIEKYRQNKIIKDRILASFHQCGSRDFDVVLATFSPEGCHAAGKAIANELNIPWVADFRDLMDNDSFTMIQRMIGKVQQASYVRSAQACMCVSEGNANKLRRQCPEQKDRIYTVYNGYSEHDCAAGNDEADEVTDLLTICYTGTIHGRMQDFHPLFRALSEIKKETSQKVRIVYAGSDAYTMITHAKKYDMDDLVEDHGYLPKAKVAMLQAQSDVFLVAAWNTNTDQGVLTGKFYEALAQRKPVIGLISGNAKGSELRSIINRNHLGVCYEEADHEKTYAQLKNWLLRQMSEKRANGHVSYQPNPEVFKTFHYAQITRGVEAILKQACSKQ